MPDYMQQSFNGGELSPQILGQLDYTKYKTGMALISNWVCLPHGPLQVRSGTEFISEVKDSSKAVRLIPFVASIDDAYVLEVGDEYTRFYNNGARIETQELVRNGQMEESGHWYDYGSPTTNERSAEQFTTGSYSRKLVASTANHGISTSQAIGSGVSYYTLRPSFKLEAGVEYTVSFKVYPSVTSVSSSLIYAPSLGLVAEDVEEHTVVADTWNTISYTHTPSSDRDRCFLALHANTTGGGGTFYFDEVSVVKGDTCEIETQYAEADVSEIDYAQSIDTLYIAHEDYQPDTVLRYGSNAWFLEYFIGLQSVRTADYQWTASGSGTNEYYLEIAGGGDPLILQEPFGFFYVFQNGTRQITYQYGLAGNFFRQGEIGSLSTYEWGWGDNDTLGYDTVYMRSSSDPDTADLNAYQIVTTPITWGLESSVFPSSVAFQNDRLIWTRQESIYGSQVSIYDDHRESDSVVDDDGLDLRLGDGQLSTILYVRPLRGLTLLSASAEWMVTGSDGSSIITANSKRADVGSRSGSDRVQPILIDNSIIHALRHKKSIKEIIYDFASEKFVGNELTVLAEHLLRNYPIKEMAFQRSPYKILWACRTDGKLLGLTYFPEHKVYGWHQHDIGGDGAVESICVIPGDGVDELWMAVNRTINGSTARYIERMHPFFVKPDHGQDYFMDDDTTDAIMMDSSYTVDGREDIVSISSADPAILNVSGLSGLWSNGDTIRIRNVVGMLDGDDESGVNGYDFTLANVSGDTAELQYEGSDFDSTTLTAYDSGGTAAKKVTAISGLDHLEGEEVTILGDGAQITSETVSGGAITLDEAASVVHVGLGYNADIETLTPRMESEHHGFLAAYEKRITAVMVRMFESSGLSIGPDADNLVDFEWIDNSVPTGHPPALFDGDKDEVSIEGPFTKNPKVYIRQAYPVPATVSAIFMDTETPS